MAQIIQFQIDRPRLVLSILVLITLALGALASGLEFDFTVENLFARNDPEVDAYFEFREEFEREDDVIYLIYMADDPFSRENLQKAHELTSGFENITGVEEVVSLANVELFEQSEDLVLAPLYGTIPKDVDSLALLKRRVLSTPLLVENLVSLDGKLAAFLISVSDDYNNHKDRERILDKIGDIQARTAWEWHEAGIPVLRTRYVQYMLDDFINFLPPVTTVLVVVLFLLFRTLRGVFLPMVTVLMADIWIMGVMALLGITINIITYIVPTLVLIIGVADSIHILVKYHEELTHNSDKLDAVAETVRKIGAAILLTSLTTAVGFFSLMSTNIVIVRQFGLMVGIAVIFAFISSVTFIPCMLVILGKPSQKRLYGTSRSLRHGVIMRIIAIVNRHPRRIVYITALIVIVFCFLAMRVDPHSSLLDDLSRGNELYDDIHFMEAEMGSALPLEVVVIVMENGTEVGDGIKDPRVVKQVVRLQAMLSTIPEIGKTISIGDYLKEMNRAFHGGETEFYTIPESRRLIAQYLMLHEEEFEFLINYDYSSTRIAGRIKDVTSRRAEEISREIMAWCDSHLPESFHVQLTGTTLMALKTNQYLVRNLVLSFTIAFGVIFISMLILFRSFKLASLLMIPNIIPLLMIAAVMGLFHIKLRPTTAMTFAIAFGIAVDDTIHFLVRFRQELFASHGKYRLANEQTLLTTGKAIISTSVILVAGFIVMVTSNFSPSRDFGLLSAITMVGALLGDLFFLPAVLTLARPRIPGLRHTYGDEV